MLCMMDAREPAWRPDHRASCHAGGMITLAGL